MSNVTITTGYICVIQIDTQENQKENMEQTKDALLDLVNSKEIQDNPFPVFIFLDLQSFSIINSSLIGAIGSAIMDDNVQLVGLCGVQPTVVDLLHRFGVIADDNQPQEFSSREIQDNFNKTYLFDTIKEGLASLG